MGVTLARPDGAGKAAPFLPMSRAEMTALGWDACDVVLVTGDAYVDHPSFGMAIIGRLLEAQGFRVGIISQPDWQSAEPFAALGKPKLFFGVTAGNMDSMVNRYTADRRIRSDDAYPKALRLQQPSHDGHAEAGMVDVSITRHEDHIATVPPERVHFLP